MKRPRTSEKIRKYASEILAVHNLTCAPVPVDQIAKHLDIRIKYQPFDGELAGMLYRKEGHVIIGVNSLDHPNRQRFTIAHELGHYRLHKSEIHIDKSFKVKRRDDISSLAIDPEEIEANRFAAELLMPFEMIKHDLLNYFIDVEDEHDIKLLANKYQVSVQAMTHRIANLIDFY